MRSRREEEGMLGNEVMGKKGEREGGKEDRK